MSEQEPTTIDLQRVIEATRQERETFEMRKRHAQSWFLLQLAMGCVSMFLITGIMVVCCVILINSTTYPDKVVIGALTALFVDILGLAAAVWKIVLNPSFVTRLEPVTKIELHSLTAADSNTDEEH